MKQNLNDLLAFDRKADLINLIKGFDNNEISYVNANLSQNFYNAKQRPVSFFNHKTILAISFGGSNTKVMLARTINGIINIEFIKAYQNPPVNEDLFVFLDKILLSNEIVKQYLEFSDHPIISASIAVSIVDGVPFHTKKIKTIDGLVARAKDENFQNYNFSTNLTKYLTTRNLKSAKIYYQGDAVIAHLGAVATSNMTTDETSLLMVCGTGMACSDEQNMLLVGMYQKLDCTNPLFPLSETEDGQLQYLIAGKGLYGFMRRAIEYKCLHENSLLKSYSLSKYFADEKDTKTVFKLWEATFTGTNNDTVKQLQLEMSPEAFIELTTLSAVLIERGLCFLTNSVVATLIKMSNLNNMKHCKIFLEGSIARNKNVVKRIMEDTFKIMNDKSVEEKPTIKMSVIPEFMIKDPIIKCNAGINISDVDLTIIGASALAFTNSK